MAATKTFIHRRPQDLKREIMLLLNGLCLTEYRINFTKSPDQYKVIPYRISILDMSSVACMELTGKFNDKG